MTDEINIDVLVGRPMALKIVEKGGPIGLEPMDLEIAQRKREAVVDADQRWRGLGKSLDQPFRDATPGPVLAGRWRRSDFDRRRVGLGRIDAQARQFVLKVRTWGKSEGRITRWNFPIPGREELRPASRRS